MTSRPLHVMTVFGTRPEAIKMAPLVRAIARTPELRQTVCVTAQHRQMLDQVLDLFEITPDIDLDLMRAGQTLPELTSRILLGMTEAIARESPDIVLVHGDTTTTFATALAAFYQRVEIGHVEAGLRTGDRYQPWPEELNRQLTGSLATRHFSPTPKARQNLLAENVPDRDIFVTGNTVIDALLWVRDRLQGLDRPGLEALFAQNVHRTPLAQKTLDVLFGAYTKRTRVILMTGHRRENLGEGFQRIISAVQALSTKYPETHIIYPVHLNPKVQEPMHAALGQLDNVHLIPPLDYAPFVRLMSDATLILTDSGGLQEEAPSLGKPVLVMRETTERPEAIEAGTARLVGTDPERIIAAVSALLDDPSEYAVMANAANPFGDGHASANIIKRLLEIR